MTNYYTGQAIPTAPTPNVNVNLPGKTTVKYPGTEAGKLWYQITRGDIDAAKISEQRALTNQQTQADAARQARDAFFESSGYKDFVNKRTNLKPTYNQSMMDTTLGQQRDILEGQTADAKRRMLVNSGGNVPSGYARTAMQTADATKTGNYARMASDLAVKKAEQDRKDEIEAIGLAAEQAKMDYGAESDLAKALERIYAVTIAKTPEYNWDELKAITDRMAEQQTYTVENEYGGGAGEGGGEGGGGVGGGGGGGDNPPANGGMPTDNQGNRLPPVGSIYNIVKGGQNTAGSTGGGSQLNPNSKVNQMIQQKYDEAAKRYYENTGKVLGA